MAILFTVVAAVVVLGFGIYAFTGVWTVRERSRTEQPAEAWYSRFADGSKRRHLR